MTKISQLPPLADDGLGYDMLFPTVAGGITKKITTEQLRKLSQPGFLFPADPSLTPGDHGKIVVNSGGKAKVAFANGTVPGVAGEWDIKSSLLIQAPKQAVYSMGLMGNPSSGDSFTFFGKTWTFVPDTPETDFEIEIGADNAATMANLVSVMDAYGSDSNFYAHQYVSGASSLLEMGSYYPGNSGNGSGFSTTNTVLYCNPYTTGSDGDYYNLGQPVAEWSKNGNTYTLTILNVCNPTAPAGSVVVGFRWPMSATDQIQNMLYALNNTPEFTDHFSVTDIGGSLRVTETAAPVAEATEFDEAGAHYNITVQQDSVAGVAQYVPDVVLGQLMYISDGQALISTERIFRARLSTDSSPVVFGTVPAHPLNRLMMYGNDGSVIFPVPFGDDMPTEFFGNGFVLALEEGEPGDMILGQAIFFAAGG